MLAEIKVDGVAARGAMAEVQPWDREDALLPPPSVRCCSPSLQRGNIALPHEASEASDTNLQAEEVL